MKLIYQIKLSKDEMSRLEDAIEKNSHDEKRVDWDHFTIYETGEVSILADNGEKLLCVYDATLDVSGDAGYYNDVDDYEFERVDDYTFYCLESLYVYCGDDDTCFEAVLD